MIREISKILIEYLEKSEFNLVDIREFLYKLSRIMKLSKVYFISYDSDTNIRISLFTKHPLEFAYLDSSILKGVDWAQLAIDVANYKLPQEVKEVLFPRSDYFVFSVMRDQSKFYCILEATIENSLDIESNIDYLKIVFKSLMDKSIQHQYKLPEVFPMDFSLNQIVERISQIVIVSDLSDNSIIFANKFAKEIFKRELVGEKCYSVIFCRDKPCKDCLYWNYDGENVVKGIYNKELNRYFNINYQFVETNLGKKYRIETAFDVTDNELIRKELLKRLDLIDTQQKALDKTAIVIIRDTEYKVIYCNQKFYDTYGLTPDEIIGKEYVSKSNIIANSEKIKSKLKKGKVWRGELRTYAKDGKEIWLDTTVIPFIKNAELQIVSINNDITESKKRESENRRLARAVEYSPASIVITDINGNIQFVNPKFTEITGYSFEEAIGQNPRILKSGEMNPEEYVQLWTEISAGKTWRGIFHNKKKDGQFFWETASISPVFDKKGTVINYIAVKQDITATRQIEAALSNSLALVRTAIESINEGIIAFDTHGSIITMNSIFLQLWQLKNIDITVLKEDEIFNLFEGSIIDILHYDSILERVFNNEYVSTFDKIELINGKIYELTVKPLIQDEKHIGRLWSFRDVTSAVRGEETLRYYMNNLERAKEELEDQTIYLAKAVSELEISKEKAEYATKTKSEFIANISHEIRTPLNAVIGFTELMREEEISIRQKEYLDSISNSGKNLLRLINDLLDISKIESGKLELQFESVNIKTVFYEIFDIFKYKIDSTRLEFMLDISELVPDTILIDEVRFRQILFNLIGNAVKFTEQGSILLSLSTIGKVNEQGGVDLKIEVTDTGIGISEQMQEHIFESFTQQSGQSNRKYGGTGLGLTITKKLVEIIGGSISIESKIGEGAKFIVVLENIKICTGDRKIPKSTSIVENEIEFIESTILAVDDIPVNLKLIEGMLRTHSIKIHTASNGAEAIAHVQEFVPDLILMDYRMPVMNGESAAIEIRKIQKNKSVKIIVLTAAAFSNQEKAELKELFDDYLIKPFTRNELIAVLRKYLPYKNKENNNTTEEALISDPIYDIDSISEEEIANALTIIKLLDGEIMQKWETAKKLSIVDRIQEFANNIALIAEENELEVLLAYSKKLHKEAMNFDFEKFPNTMKEYPEIIQRYLNTDLGVKIK